MDIQEMVLLDELTEAFENHAKSENIPKLFGPNFYISLANQIEKNFGFDKVTSLEIAMSVECDVNTSYDATDPEEVAAMERFTSAFVECIVVSTKQFEEYIGCKVTPAIVKIIAQKSNVSVGS